MTTKKAVARAGVIKKSAPKKSAEDLAGVQAALKWLKGHSTKRTLDGMARYAIPSDKALGVSMSDMKALAKRLGQNHELAEKLWQTDIYEARTVAALIDEPSKVTAGQMDRWCRDFDNWAICDTACFALFDRTPYAWRKVEQWSKQHDEFVKRAAFALLWSLTVHDKQAGDKLFTDGLGLIELAANDERHFVKKAVNMALRAVGKRNATLNAAAVIVAKRLASSAKPVPCWIGKHALRELTSAVVIRAMQRRTKAK